MTVLRASMLVAVVILTATTASSRPATIKEFIPDRSANDSMRFMFADAWPLRTLKPGLANRPYAEEWDRALVVGRWMRLYFFGGSLTCWVVDRVDISYRKREIVVTIFGGYRNLGTNKLCTNKSQSQRIDVNLREPLNGRTVGDGARRLR